MSKSKVYFTYCSDNHELIDHIAADLGRVDIDFHHDIRIPTQRLDSQMANDNAPIYLFISDNFLKSQNCMDGALKFIDNFRLKPRIKPVVINGIVEKNGVKQEIETKFDKVSNVIRYMNYWQDEYLRLRRERRDVPESEAAEFQAKIDKIRKISNEIGEFLRSLRGFNYLSYEEFSNNKFKKIFDQLGYDGNLKHNRYLALPPLPEEVELPPLEVPPNININDIPGLDLINKSTPEPTVGNEISDELTEEVINEVEEDEEVINEVIETPNIIVDELVEVIEDEEVINEVVETPDTIVDEVVEEEDEEIINEVVETPDTIVDEVEEEVVEEEDTIDIPDTEEEVIINEIPPSEEEEVPTIDDGELDLPTEEEVPTEEEILGETPDDDYQETPLPSDNHEENSENVDEFIDSIIEEELDEIEEIIEEVEEEELTEEVIEDTEEVVSEVIENEDADELMESIIKEVEKGDASEKEEEVPADLPSDDEKVLVEDIAQDLVEQLNKAETPKTIEKAVALDVSENTDEAKAEYEIHLSQNPQNTSVKLAYARLLQDEIGDELAAKSQLEEIMLDDKADEEVYFRLGQIAEQNGEFRVAKNYYERAITSKRDYADAYFRLGEIMASNYDNQQFVAKAYYQEAIRLSNSDSDILYRYAKFLSEKMKDHKKAKDILREIIILDENNAKAYFALAELHLNVFGKKKKARKYYKEACDIDAFYKTDANDELFKAKKEVNEVRTEEVLSVAPTTAPKTVLITGATSGIGKAIAELFASNGHRVIITGRREDRLEELATSLKDSFKTNVKTLAFDVRSHEDSEAALNQLDTEWQNIDILINNAGLAKGYHDIHKGMLHHWETMIDTNIKGLLYMTRLVSPHMVKRKQGHIINIGSIAGKEVYPKGNVYCATKAAVDALTKGMRIDLHKHNIKVTAVHPGHVETEFAVVRFDGDEEKAKIYEDFQPLTAYDVAETVYFAATRPPHVNIQDIVMWSTQQATATIIDRSGR